MPVLTGSAWVEEQERVLTFVLDLSDLKRAEGALRFLATASRVLGQSLEVSDATLQDVAGLASISVASWCVIDRPLPRGCCAGRPWRTGRRGARSGCGGDGRCPR
ncbi:hypothetical protein ACN28S_05270 [Cystobacter fuscus]